MELRTLEYFLAIAREGNITNAAKALHITQPTLSRQLASLETEFGRQLYTRSHKGIDLTADGTRLLAYAESIVELSRKAQQDMKPETSQVEGVVHLGAGETHLMSLVAHAMHDTQRKHPGITFELTSGRTIDLKDGLVKGFYDVMLECEVSDHAKLNVMRLPVADTWGVIMRTDDPLAQRSAITAEDLLGRKLITSIQGMKFGKLAAWFGPLKGRIDVVAEYQLPLNVTFLVREGLGLGIAYQHLIDGSDDNGDLCSRPLSPAVESHQGLVWRNATPNRQTQVFLDEMQSLCTRIGEDPQLGRDILFGT